MLSATACAHDSAPADDGSAPPPPGESAALDSARAVRGASLTVSLYTYGPSDVFFERFGHAAVGIRDSVTGQDLAFNWGIFDFAQPNFLGRFLTGDTKYSTAGYPTTLFNNAYQGDNRTIRQQVLALTPVERAALWEYVQWNASDAHKFYRYDYYNDNCSTRVRDLLDRVLRGKLKSGLSQESGTRTWRGETARILAYNPALYAGIELALGRHADEPLTPWREEFLPEHMAAHLSSLVLTSDQGQRYKLVSRDTVLFTATREPIPSEPPSRLLISLVLGLALAGVVAMLADASAFAARAAVTVFAAVWFVIGGLAGTALLLAATVTKHAPYMGANTSLMALQPLLLVAAVAVPIALWRSHGTRTARNVSSVIALLSLMAVIVQLVPALRQSNGVVLAMVVPVHIAFAIAMMRLPNQRRSASARPRR